MTTGRDRSASGQQSLRRLYSTHEGKVADKWLGYLDEYDRLFEEYRHKPISLLEIGVQNGGSLEIWARYFTRARKIVGCDIDPACGQLSYGDSRIAVVVGDINSDATEKAILRHASAFDIIIDDGSHQSRDIVKAFARYFPHLTIRGVYVVEDLHCSYMQSYEGGLYDPFSSLTFFKRLADAVNHEHWGVAKPVMEVFNGFSQRYNFDLSEQTLEAVHSVEFTNSLAVIRKDRFQHNRLGRRIVAGSEGVVAPGFSEWPLQQFPVSDQSDNEWTARTLPPDEELPLRIAQLSDLQADLQQRASHIVQLQSLLQEKASRLTQLESSLKEKDSQIARLESSLEEKSSCIIQLEQELSHRESDTGKLRRRIANLEAELAAVYSSYSWRITAPLRTGYHGLQGMLRNARRAFTLAEWLLTGQFRRAGNALLPYYVCFVPLRIRRLVPTDLREEVKCRLTSSDSRGAGKRAAFDSTRARKFQRRIETLFHRSRSRFDGVKVSVVMPTYNRGHLVPKAIRSVIRQSHTNWELLVIDDGSTDGTAEVIRAFLDDERIKFIEQEHRGVSAARNTGLKLASGEIVAYLDTDNVWRPSFLRNMIVFMQTEGYKCAYAGLAAVNGRGQLLYYRGRDFNWDTCLAGNYIDLNVYCHRMELYESGLCFDESLRRMVDWDLILRHARHVSCQVGYAPFIGCEYLDARNDYGRITTSQPLVYGKIVQLCNSSPGCNGVEISRNLTLRIVIKTAAPRDRRLQWGDYYYAEALASALGRLGHVVRMEFLGEDASWLGIGDDVVIVLRGLNSREPQQGAINMMWNISHPDQVDYSEYDSFDIVYVASSSYTGYLSHVTSTSVRTLLQATDPNRFFPLVVPDPKYSDQLVFVGNSRNEYRKILRWAVEEGLSPAIYGTGWEQFVPFRFIYGTHIENERLHELYSSARAVLNDHWASMAEYGFISNRVFDVLAAGGRLISDAVPSIRTVFDGAVTEVRSAEELRYALVLLSTETASESRKSVARSVAVSHSFDARARLIVDDVLEFLGLPTLHRETIESPECHFEAPVIIVDRPVTVNAIVDWSGAHPKSSAFIRLVCPLTCEALVGNVALNLFTGTQAQDAIRGDVCIVSRGALTTNAAQVLVEEARKRGTGLIVDNDDAFCLMAESSHPERDQYSERNSTLAYLMEMAEATWFSTQYLAEAYCNYAAAPEVMPNMADPRVWCDYRNRRPPIGTHSKLRLLYMGTATHDQDFDLILPALDEAAAHRPNTFELTIIGAVRKPPSRPWLHTVSPPSGATSYPRFARWLLAQKPWDVGLAPLADTPFNRCKSDIKFLEYAAMGVTSVVSDCAAYRASALESNGAVLVNNSLADWTDAFLNLIDNLPQFQPIVDAATEYVWTKRHVSRVAHQQVRELRHIVEDCAR